MDATAKRAALATAIEASGKSFAQLSRLIGRNSAYLQQYVKLGSPRELAERDARTLARFLGIDEAAIGGAPAGPDVVAVTRLDVGASAGPGGLADGEARKRPGLFDPLMLRQLGVRPEAASMIRVAGDSMVPTLADGDEILVDRDRRRPGVRGELFVLRVEGAVMVKRLRAIGRDIEVASDNSDYETRMFALSVVDVIGRVVWLGRTLL